MILCFLFSALIVALDQFFKQWIVRTIDIGAIGPEIIPGVLGLTHWENDGAMLNILSGQQWLLAAIAFTASLALVFILLRYNEGFWGTLSLAAVLGGTVGNLLDRIFNHGKVVDMFRTLFINFPIFNIADIFITLGFITFLIHFITLTVNMGKDTDALIANIERDFGEDIDAEDVADIESLTYTAAQQTSAEPQSVAAVDVASVAAVAPVAPSEYEVAPVVPEYAPAAPVTPVVPIATAPVVAAPIIEPQVSPVAPVSYDNVASVSDYDSVTDTTPDISYTLEALEAEIGSLDTDYDLDEILREYGIEDDDITV